MIYYDNVLFCIGMWIMSTITLIVLTILFGRVSGIFIAEREAAFRRRAIKIAGRKGAKQEFLIISGDAAVVDELYRVVVATTQRVQEITEDEGIKIDGEATDRPRRA